jgi:predicted small lipoprotein YifL
MGRGCMGVEMYGCVGVERRTWTLLPLRALCVSAVIIAFCALAGCGPKGEPGSTPAANVTTGTPQPEPRPAQPVVTEVRSLETTRSTEFQIPVGKQSLTVVEYYDAELAKQGWKDRMPRKQTEPGARKWITIPVKVGMTDGYEAAWVHPPSGRGALLFLWHETKDPDVQHGTFDLFSRGQAPWEASP